MDEALQNVMDYIDTEGTPLKRSEWRELLGNIIDDCKMRLEASEDEVDEEDEDEEE
jgi:hypothetical protein